MPSARGAADTSPGDGGTQPPTDTPGRSRNRRDLLTDAEPYGNKDVGSPQIRAYSPGVEAIPSDQAQFGTPKCRARFVPRTECIPEQRSG
jgi:hypothetical protein